jgi:hypothetical protein
MSTTDGELRWERTVHQDLYQILTGCQNQRCYSSKRKMTPGAEDGAVVEETQSIQQKLVLVKLMLLLPSQVHHNCEQDQNGIH